MSTGTRPRATPTGGPGTDTRVPFCDLSRTQPVDELAAAAHRVISSGRFVGGSEVADFEAEFAARCGARECVGVSSGTSALQAALAAGGVRAGDEVVTVSATFTATAAAVTHCGALPVFADIDPARRTLDPAALAAAFTERTRAVIAVDLYGQPADLEPLARLAHDHGVPLIEDAAQAHGSTYRGWPVGSIADLTCFSFYPSKNLGALGDAGAVTTDDPELADRIRRLRDHGRPPGHELPELLGHNWRLDALQAAFLRVKLRLLPQWTAERRAIAARYAETLAGLPFGLPGDLPDSAPAHHLYVVTTPDRDALRAFLAERGIDTRLHYPYAVHRLEPFRRFTADPDRLPHTDALVDGCLSLPMFPGLTPAEVDRVAAAVAEWAATTGQEGTR